MRAFLASTVSTLADGCPAGPVRIMPLGDSLTAGEPSYRQSLLARLRADGLRVEFVGSQSGSTAHEGHPGFTFGPGNSKADDRMGSGRGNLYVHIADWIAAARPDMVLLFMGANEFFNINHDGVIRQPGYRAEEDGPRRLGALLDRVHAAAPAAEVVYSSVLPMRHDRHFADGYNRALPALAGGRPYARYADLARAIALEDEDWGPDGLHLTASGHDRLARAWHDALSALLKTRDGAGRNAGRLATVSA